MSDTEARLKELREEMDKVSALQEQVEQPTIELPKPPKLPKEVDLDHWESLCVDAIVWREDAAKANIRFAKSELDGCKQMRQNLMAKLVARLGINPETHTLNINKDERKAIVVPR